MTMPLREFIEKNFWWKLASIMSAGLIWFTIYYSSIEGKVIPSKNRAEENSALIFPLPIKVMSSAGEARGFVVTPPDADVPPSSCSATAASAGPNSPRCGCATSISSGAV